MQPSRFWTPAELQLRIAGAEIVHVLLAHNDYGSFSGEEAAVENVAASLQQNGHRVTWLRRSSAEIGASLTRKAGAFLSGIYSAGARREIERLLDNEGFDLVQVQNLYPFLSASILPPCRERGVPVVMRCPNYRLFCPSGLHLRDGSVCVACLGRGREWNCVAHNCEGDQFKSLGYAARNAFGRMSGMIRENVTIFIVLSEFQRQRFIEGGIAADRLQILHNTTRVPEDVGLAGEGEWVAFVGRISEEKGVREILEAARRLPHVPFRIAGIVSGMPEACSKAPPNVQFVGFLSGTALEDFYSRTRILLSPSKWFEGFPNTIASAMAHGKPVIGTRIGAIPEVVDDGITGLLALPGDSRDLADKIECLWADQAACRSMGTAGRDKVMWSYSQERFYSRLMEIYGSAQAMARH